MFYCMYWDLPQVDLTSFELASFWAIMSFSLLFVTTRSGEAQKGECISFQRRQYNAVLLSQNRS